MPGADLRPATLPLTYRPGSSAWAVQLTFVGTVPAGAVVSLLQDSGDPVPGCALSAAIAGQVVTLTVTGGVPLGNWRWALNLTGLPVVGGQFTSTLTTTDTPATAVTVTVLPSATVTVAVTGLLSTDASLLTSGILPAARIGAASITSAKVDASISTPAAVEAAIRARLAQQGENLWQDGELWSGGLTGFAGAGLSYTNVVPVGKGGIQSSVAYQAVASAFTNAIDPLGTYEMSMWAKAPTTESLLGAVIPYDIDGSSIVSYHSSQEKFVGAVDTTLWAALVPGATIVTLTDGTGWAGAANTIYDRVFGWWPYLSTNGYQYPNYTYTRNISAVSNAWVSRTGNVLTLSAPWAGPTLPVGTPIANRTNGAGYLYPFGLPLATNVWTRFVGQIGPAQAVKWRDGTAFVGLSVLTNYSGGTSQTVAGMRFRRAS